MIRWVVVGCQCCMVFVLSLSIFLNVVRCPSVLLRSRTSHATPIYLSIHGRVLNNFGPEGHFSQPTKTMLFLICSNEDYRRVFVAVKLLYGHARSALASRPGGEKNSLSQTNRSLAVAPQTQEDSISLTGDFMQDNFRCLDNSKGQ